VSRSRLASLVFVTALTVSACDGEPGGPLQVRDNAFVWKDVVAPGLTVKVRDFAGDIEVKPSADDTVRVTARLTWTRGNPDERLSFSGSATPGVGALICAIWGDGRCTAEDYQANMKFGRDDAKVYFTVEVPNGVKLDLTTISGDIAVSSSAQVHAMTMNGDVRVATAVGPVKGETLNGSVDIRMASLAGTDSVIGKTLNGEVYIYLASLDDAVLDLGVANGSVSNAFSMTGLSSEGKHVRGTIGAGSRVVHGYAMNGSVALRRLSPDGTAP
jgi:hypothetical protein